MKLRWIPGATATVLAIWAVTVHAGGRIWHSTAEGKRLEFTARYLGEAIPGRFGEFSVRLETEADSGAPTALQVEVATASADMNDRDVNDALQTPEWFGTQAWPTAVFESRDIRPTANGYRARGKLRIKGLEQPVDLLLNWNRDGQQGELSGEVGLSRGAFRVGSGEWAGDERISDRVDVRYRVRLIADE